MPRLLPVLAFAALVAGCAGNAVPASPVSAPSTSRSIARPSLVDPLLYVGDLGTSEVVVNSYPQGKPKFTLSSPGSVNGVCADFDGNVYVTDAHDGELLEFQYASTKQLRMLKDPGYYLGGCSVDLVNGDVAVAIQATNSDAGGIAIFRNGKGKPRNYTGASTYFPHSCAYDGKGNLYVDGTALNGSFFLAELPARHSTFTIVNLDQSITAAGGVQWDARRNLVVVNDQGVGYQGSTIYEFSVNGTTGTKKGTTPLTGSTDVTGFTLDESGSGRVIGTNTGSTPGVMYWRYPKGGNPTKTLTGFSEPVSVAIASEPSAGVRF